MSIQVKFSNPGNISMGAPLVAHAELAGTDWRPSLLDRGLFYYQITAVSGRWIALSRFDVSLDRANFTIYLLDTENRKIYASASEFADLRGIEILSDKRVKAFCQSGGLEKEMTIEQWQEIS